MNKNKQGYSVILSLLLVGLLLVITTGIFQMVLKEMFDTRGITKALKASAAAEGAQEIALWQLKNYWYWFAEDTDHSINARSVALWEYPKNEDRFHKNRDVFFSNTFDAKANSYEGTLDRYETHIIPLFYRTEKQKYHIWPFLEFRIISGDENAMVWNILSTDTGITWVGDFDSSSEGNRKDAATQEFSTAFVETFLLDNEIKNNYLILYNSSEWEIIYNLDAGSEYFVKPKISIISSAQIGKYKQNIQTNFTNREFLYSLFSN